LARNHKPVDNSIEPFEPEAIKQFKQAIADGKHWYIALLEAIGLWETAEETIKEQTRQYIIANEAFDWLLLAERLCESAKELLPEDETTALLFYGKPPLDLPTGEFKKLIGNAKHHQHLNYFYGITAEEALILAVEDEVRKERRGSGILRDTDTSNEAYRRIYGFTRAVLLRQSDKAKVASDTKKALDWLETRGYFRHSGKRNIEEEIIEITPS
jgi:hypothetical protein